MGEYVYTVICAALCTAVVLSLSPDGEGGNIGKYVAFAGALVMALTMLSPVAGLLKNISFDGIDISDTAEEAETKRGEYLADSAGTVLSALYGVDRKSLSARIYEDDGGELLCITLILEKGAGFNKDEAAKLLSQIYEIKFEIEEKG